MSLWSIKREQTLAHEIGHAFSLQHVSETENLVHARASNEARRSPTRMLLDDEEVDTLRYTAWRFEDCAKKL